MSYLLIVDDVGENVVYLTTLLRAHGFEVKSGRNGVEAIALARAQLPAAVISDLLMPVMDGYRLLGHWKADARLMTIPFIVYTATYVDAADERLARDLGADAFIRKPAEPQAFIAELRKALAQFAGGRACRREAEELGEGPAPAAIQRSVDPQARTQNSPAAGIKSRVAAGGHRPQRARTNANRHSQRAGGPHRHRRSRGHHCIGQRFVASLRQCECLFVLWPERRRELSGGLRGEPGNEFSRRTECRGRYPQRSSRQQPQFHPRVSLWR